MDTGLLARCEDNFQSLGNPLAVSRIRLAAVRNMAVPNLLLGRSERASRVLKQTLLFLRAEHTEEVARLRVVVVILFPEVEVVPTPVDPQRQPREIGLLLPLAVAVRLV